MSLCFKQLVNHFGFNPIVFIVIFVIIGLMVVFITIILWIVMRLTTHLQTPPEPKVFSVFSLIAPPPAAGTVLGILPATILLTIGYRIVTNQNWFFPLTELAAKSTEGTWYVDLVFPIDFGSLVLPGQTQIIDPSTLDSARAGRMGTVFFIIGICSIMVGSHIFIPKRVFLNNIKPKKLEPEEVWAPTWWKRIHFVFCSFVLALVLVMIIEFSYWTSYSMTQTFFWNVYMLKVFTKFIDMMFYYFLKEEILMAPIRCALKHVIIVVTLGSANFVTFLARVIIGYGNTLVERIYFDPTWKYFLDRCYAWINYIIATIRRIVPKYLRHYLKAEKLENTPEEEKLKLKQLADLQRGRDHADTVEPILRSFADVCIDTCSNFHMPFIIFLFIQFRTQIMLPILYGIGSFSMYIYLYYFLVIIIFFIIADVVLLSVQELFHGWKIYEYLVYSRYRFLQRETRWKGLEDSLDECIEEEFRTIDQMCFSSQFYFMLMVHFNGIIFITLGMEIWLRNVGYNPFQDTATVLLAFIMMAMAVVVRWLLLRFALLIKL